LKRAPAAVIFAAPFQRPNAQSEKPVDLDFYTGSAEMQAARQIKDLDRDG
jgi:hypothetical protein